MKINKLMLGACVFSLGIATAASTYHVKIADPTWVGQTELKPGEYDVKVDGRQGNFQDGQERDRGTGQDRNQYFQIC